jgi:tetraacyldisaccharide 4'-kinase
LLAEEKFPSQLHLLDDGFQHRRLHRDFDIVIAPASDFLDTLLPVGRLREPVPALHRADALVLHGPSPLDKSVAWPARRQTMLDKTEGNAIAFCGIARPGQFFGGLHDLDIDLCDTVSFPDHHRYTDQDIARLLELQARAGVASFITTEKDLINLGSLAGRLQPMHAAQLVVSLEDPNFALSTLFATLERRSGCRF